MLAVQWQFLCATVIYDDEPLRNNALPADTGRVVRNVVVEEEDNPFKKVIVRSDTDTITNFPRHRGEKDYSSYILDRRYRATNDSALPWYRNVFVQVGTGFEQMVPPSKAYHFDALTQAHGGLGIQLNSYHSLRGMLQASLGYQKKYNRMFARLSVKLDHLFDWTSYFDGYRADRLFGISTIAGVGAQYSFLNNTGKRGKSFEAHVGAQLRFFTGPHGTMNVEPFIGVGTDQCDLSRNSEWNWRRYDIFYGINVNYVYYFSNHLSRAARMRQLSRENASERKVPNRRKDALTDSLLLSWQSPWVLEYSGGINFTDASDLPLVQTMGHNVTFSLGKWFSPVIGLKGSLHSRTLKWRQEESRSGTALYQTDYNTQYYSARAEGMFNPLGFSRRFRWDAPFGAYLLLGGEFGWFIKEQSGRSLHCRSEAYTAGLHLWTRLAEGVQVFLEPRWMYNVYKIPYSNVNWKGKFSDNTYSINLGLTAISVPPRFRRRRADGADIGHGSLSVGVGLGSNVIQNVLNLKGSTAFPWNTHAFASYKFDQTSGIRLSFEFFTRPSSAKTNYTDYNMRLSQDGYAPVLRNGQWNHNYRIGLLSLGYNADMGSLFAGRQVTESLFRLEGFLGPAVMFFFGEGGGLDQKESLREGHKAMLDDNVDGNTYFAINVGAMLSTRLSPHIRLTLTPQVNYVPNLRLPTLNMTRLRLFEHLDLGVQYSF